MGRKGKETTPEERKIAFNMKCRGSTFREIAETLQRPLGTVISIVNRFKNIGQFINRARKGRPNKLNASNERFLVKEIKRNPRVTGPELVTMLRTTTGTEVSSATIKRAIKKHGYRSCIARNKPYISKKNKQKRLNFAKSHEAKGQEFWNRVIFTDESKFNLHQSDGKIRIFRQRNTALQERNLKGTVKHGGGSVMVWGCMSANGVGNLVVIDGIMTAKKYIDLLKANLNPSLEKMGMEDNYIFTQDNDPKHKAMDTRLYLLYNTKQYLETPPQSPDINPIENLWAHLDAKIRERTINTKRDLIIALKEEWEKISTEITKRLVDSMPNRLASILNNKGGPTKY